MPRRKEYLPIGKEQRYQIYHDLYDRFRLESKILNGGSEKVPNAHMVFWDEQNLDAELYSIRGDKDGFYAREGEYHIALIPFVLLKLDGIEKAFKRYQKQRVNQGYKKPDNMPQQMLDELLKYEAHQDVLNEEVTEIEKRLKIFREKIIKRDDSLVLQYGLKCQSHFWGSGAPSRNLINVIHEMDGQDVGQTKDGILIIKDVRSPYNGMAIVDYRGLSAQWLRDGRLREQEKLKRRQAEAREKGLPIPQELEAKAPRKISKSSLPIWPKGIKNHLEPGESEKESGVSNYTRKPKYIK